MATISQVYDLPDSAHLRCEVRGRLALPGAVVEIHHYRFRGPQRGFFRPARGFLDLALSRRPGGPTGICTAFAGSGPRPIGDMFFVPAGEAVETAWGEGEQLSVCCGLDMMAEALRFDERTFEAALDLRSPYLREALIRLRREIEEPGFCSELLAQAIMTEIAVELARYLRQPAVHVEGGETRLTVGQLRRIDDLIESPGKLPGIAELARSCDVSTRHFFRLFRATTGQTLAAYAAEKRLARAKELLATPRPAIKEIAWRCGFETPAAFSAAFRKAMGVTPKGFRQSLLN